MNKPILVTAALPYANGSIHIGHLVEYIMTDVYVRGLRMCGEEAYYICADDTHGTPIEVNAQKAGVKPEEFVARFAKEHVADFESFEIRFDHFDSTNSDENRQWAFEIYERLKSGGHITEKPLEMFYDEQAKRFLPDRFVKGTCPFCKTADQYGDVCESCKRTYQPTDLLDPYSVVTGSKPVLRSSTHLFVDLSRFASFLEPWVRAEGRMAPEIRAFVDTWLNDGLKEWCISRDAPYFGFEIPDRPGKYFYVWLDAPVGYISSTSNWARKTGDPSRADHFWRHDGARVEHVIGKDIVYFHTLFWPAMLKAAELTLPSRIHVHGMLQVNGEKMSKSRGTFVNARTFRDHLEPSYLRYYYASKIGPRPDDIDLALGDFVNKVNAELVNNLANLVSRAASFIKTRLGGRYGRLPAGARTETERDFVAQKVKEAEAAYRGFDLQTAVRCAVEIGDRGNKIFQDEMPWKTVESDPAGTLETVTLCLNLARAATAIVAPAVPSVAERIYGILGLPGAPERLAEAKAFDLVDRDIGEPTRIIDRITLKQVEAIIEASKPAETEGAKPTPAKKEPKVTAEKPSEPISIDDFAKVQLKVGLVKNAELVEGADKLLKLTVDLGEAQPRTIFAGIRAAYSPDQVIGKRVAVVANLAPRKMRFGVSEGMVLAAGEGGADIQILTVSDEAKPGASIK